MTVEDVGILKVREEWMRQAYQRYLESHNGYAWVLEGEDGPICAFGGAFLWGGVCEIWFNLICKKHTIAVIRIAKRYLEEQAGKNNVHRLQATTKCDSVVGNKFIKWFGFKNETPDGMKNYNPDGSDAYLYAKII
jgi:hypothetical protein